MKHDQGPRWYESIGFKWAVVALCVIGEVACLYQTSPHAPLPFARIVGRLIFPIGFVALTAYASSWRTKNWHLVFVASYIIARLLIAYGEAGN